MQPRYLFATLLFFSSAGALSQPLRSPGPIRYSVEVGGLATSAPQNPFWFRVNQYNIVPVRGSFGTLRFGLSRDYKPRPTDSSATHKSRFDWGFGLYAVANVGPRPSADNPTFLLPDAYVKVRFGVLELYGGNRREVIGLGDTLLTSGFVAWSGNAATFPKIQLHTPDFVPIGFTKKLLAFRAGYAHGWLVNSYIQGSYLHHKYLYGRLGKPNWRFRLYGGLNHQVQWGGRADYLIGTPLAVNGSLSTSFQDYLSLVTGRYPDALENDRFTGFDGTNRLGNHVGSYDVAFEWKGKRHNWLLYHQHMYDDASGLALQNVPDGLTGLRLLNQSGTNARFRFRRVVLEWLSTTNQSGPEFDPSARYQGADNYFNHSQYREGWSYRGRTLGTPFIMPRPELDPAVGNTYGGNGYYPNNRVVAWYLGAIGAFRHGPSLTTRVSYSRNFGSYKQPYPQVFHQLSTSLAAQWPIPKWPGTQLTTSLALDRGELMPNSFAGYISLKKSW